MLKPIFCRFAVQKQQRVKEICQSDRGHGGHRRPNHWFGRVAARRGRQEARRVVDPSLCFPHLGRLVGKLRQQTFAPGYDLSQHAKNCIIKNHFSNSFHEISGQS